MEPAAPAAPAAATAHGVLDESTRAFARMLVRPTKAQQSVLAQVFPWLVLLDGPLCMSSEQTGETLYMLDGTLAFIRQQHVTEPMPRLSPTPPSQAAATRLGGSSEHGGHAEHSQSDGGSDGESDGEVDGEDDEHDGAGVGGSTLVVVGYQVCLHRLRNGLVSVPMEPDLVLAPAEFRNLAVQRLEGLLGPPDATPEGLVWTLLVGPAPGFEVQKRGRGGAAAPIPLRIGLAGAVSLHLSGMHFASLSALHSAARPIGKLERTMERYMGPAERALALHCARLLQQLV